MADISAEAKKNNLRTNNFRKNNISSRQPNVKRKTQNKWQRIIRKCLETPDERLILMNCNVNPKSESIFTHSSRWRVSYRRMKSKHSRKLLATCFAPKADSSLVSAICQLHGSIRPPAYDWGAEKCSCPRRGMKTDRLDRVINMDYDFTLTKSTWFSIRLIAWMIKFKSFLALSFCIFPQFYFCLEQLSEMTTTTCESSCQVFKRSIISTRLRAALKEHIN